MTAQYDRRLRYRKASWLAPIQVHNRCRLCTGLCCRLKGIHVVLTFIERMKILRGELTWKVAFSVPNPNANRRYEAADLHIIGKNLDKPEDASEEIREATDEEIVETSKQCDVYLEELYRRSLCRFARVGGITGHPREYRSNYHQVVWYLAKKSNGECLYFNSKKQRCGIYTNRPRACKVWFCELGDKNDRRRTFQKLCKHAREEGKEDLIST